MNLKKEMEMVVLGLGVVVQNWRSYGGVRGCGGGGGLGSAVSRASRGLG